MSPPAPAGKRLPHFAHFLCATFQVCYPSSQTQKRGIIIQLCLRWGPVSAATMPLAAPSITAPKPQEETRGFQFNHRHQGKWGKSLPANPKEIPLSSHLSPLTGGNKSRKGRFTRRKTFPPYWIFFPPSPNNASYL